MRVRTVSLCCISACGCFQTRSNCWACSFSCKIRLTVNLSEAVTDTHPLERPLPSTHSPNVQESCPLWGHFLKLSMFLFWVQKSLDRLTMRPIVTGRSIRIKEVINQLTGLRGQYCSLQGKQCSHSQPLGEHSAASTGSSWQHATKITAHREHIGCTLLTLTHMQTLVCLCVLH